MNDSALDISAALKVAAQTVARRQYAPSPDLTLHGARLFARGLRLEMLANLPMPPEAVRAFSPLIITGSAVTGLLRRGIAGDVYDVVAAVQVMFSEDESGEVTQPEVWEHFHSLSDEDQSRAYNLFSAGMLVTVASLRGSTVRETVEDYLRVFSATMIDPVDWSDVEIPES